MEWKDAPQSGDPSDDPVDFDPAGYSVLHRRDPAAAAVRWLRRPAVLAGIGLVTLFVVLALLRFGGSSGDGVETAGLETRLDRLEHRLAAVDGPRQPVADTAALADRIDALAQRLDRSEAALSRRIEELEKRLRQAPAPTAKAPAAPPTPPPAPSTARTHEVRKGDTLYSISREAGIGVERLRELNDLAPGQAIHPGDRLRLGP